MTDLLNKVKFARLPEYFQKAVGFETYNRLQHFKEYQDLLDFTEADNLEFAARKPKAPKIGTKITQKGGRVITCDPSKTYPCGNVCRGQDKPCNSPIDGQAKTYAEFLKLQPKTNGKTPLDKSDKTLDTGKNKPVKQGETGMSSGDRKQEKVQEFAKTTLEAIQKTSEFKELKNLMSGYKNRDGSLKNSDPEWVLRFPHFDVNNDKVGKRVNELQKQLQSKFNLHPIGDSNSFNRFKWEKTFDSSTEVKGTQGVIPKPDTTTTKPEKEVATTAAKETKPRNTNLITDKGEKIPLSPQEIKVLTGRDKLSASDKTILSKNPSIVMLSKRIAETGDDKLMRKWEGRALVPGKGIDSSIAKEMLKDIDDFEAGKGKTATAAKETKPAASTSGEERSRSTGKTDKPTASKIKSYEDAAKTPEGGWTKGDADNKRATISQGLASLGNGLPSNPKVFYDWSVKHGIDLEDLISKQGKKLTKKAVEEGSEESLALMKAVYEDKPLVVTKSAASKSGEERSRSAKKQKVTKVGSYELTDDDISLLPWRTKLLLDTKSGRDELGKNKELLNLVKEISSSGDQELIDKYKKSGVNKSTFNDTYSKVRDDIYASKRKRGIETDIDRQIRQAKELEGLERQDDLKRKNAAKQAKEESIKRAKASGAAPLDKDNLEKGESLSSTQSKKEFLEQYRDNYVKTANAKDYDTEKADKTLLEVIDSDKTASEIAKLKNKIAVDKDLKERGFKASGSGTEGRLSVQVLKETKAKLKSLEDRQNKVDDFILKGGFHQGLPSFMSETPSDAWSGFVPPSPKTMQKAYDLAQQRRDQLVNNQSKTKSKSFTEPNTPFVWDRKAIAFYRDYPLNKTPSLINR